MLGVAGDKNLKIAIIERHEDFLALEKDWNRLLAESGIDNIFLTFEWLTCWWKFFGKGRELFILLAKEADEIIGIAPFMVSKIRKVFPGFRVISFMGIESSAYADFIIKKGREEALTTIMKFLEDNRSLWDIIQLKQIPEDSLNLNFLKEFEGKSGYFSERREALPCFYIPLNNGWDAYFASFDSDDRRNFKRRLKRLSEAGEVSFVHYGNDGQEDANKIVPILMDIFDKRWGAKKKLNPFSSPEKKEFIKEVARRFQKNSWLDLAVLKCGGQIIAYTFGFFYNRKYWGWNISFDPAFSKYGAGALIIKETVEYAFRKNLSELDMLQGESSYKTAWARSKRKTFEILICKKGILPGLLYLWSVKLKPWLKESKTLKNLKETIEHLKFHSANMINDSLKLIKRAWTAYKNKGILAVIKRIGFFFLRYERFYFYELALPDNAELLPPELAGILELVTKRQRYEIKWLTNKSTDGLESYLAYRKDVSRRQAVNLLRRGHSTVIVLDKGKIVGDCWLATDSFPLLPGCKKIADMFQRRGYAYGFRAYVEPAYRSRGIMPLFVCEQAKVLRKHAIKSLLGIVKPDNLSSLVSLEKMGWKNIYQLDLLYLMGIKLYQNGKDKAQTKTAACNL